MIEVYWLEQTQADVPHGGGWLSPDEVVRLTSMSIPKRAADWRLGRWTAKRTLASYLSLPQHFSLSRIELRPAPSGAPEVFIANEAAPVSVSLTHSGGVAACAVASTGVSLGCDLERVETRSELFVADYFTTEEQKIISGACQADRALIVNLLWSAKESALKVMQVGLRNDTRSVSVSLNGASSAHVARLSVESSHKHEWRPLQVCGRDGRRFEGLWFCEDGLVRTLAVGLQRKSS